MVHLYIIEHWVYITAITLVVVVLLLVLLHKWFMFRASRKGTVVTVITICYFNNCRGCTLLCWAIDENLEGPVKFKIDRERDKHYQSWQALNVLLYKKKWYLVGNKPVIPAVATVTMVADEIRRRGLLSVIC